MVEEEVEVEEEEEVVEVELQQEDSLYCKRSFKYRVLEVIQSQMLHQEVQEVVEVVLVVEDEAVVVEVHQEEEELLRLIEVKLWSLLTTSIFIDYYIQMQSCTN